MFFKRQMTILAQQSALAWRQPGTLETLIKDVDVRRQPPSFVVKWSRRCRSNRQAVWN
jgi:hypothetical protein